MEINFNISKSISKIIEKLLISTTAYSFQEYLKHLDGSAFNDEN